MHGIIPALISSYDAAGRPDLARDRAIIDHLIGQGVDGVFIGGSTGEAFLQDIGERKTVMAAAIEAVAGRVTTIAHVGAMNAEEAIELARLAGELGADAICAITPIYYALSSEAHAAFFRRLADAVDLPLIAYHIPGRSGVSLPLDWFTALGREGVLAGVKYTSTDLYLLAELKRELGAGFTIFNGSDEVLAGGLALGADGGIGSTYNVMPGLYARLYRAMREGRTGEALDLQRRANRVIALMNDYNFLAFLRTVLGAQGLFPGWSRAPLPSFTTEQRQEVTDRIASDAVIRDALGL